LQHKVLHGIILLLVALLLTVEITEGKQNDTQRLLPVRLNNLLLQHFLFIEKKKSRKTKTKKSRMLTTLSLLVKLTIPLTPN
jgi:hypothetical protein